MLPATTVSRPSLVPLSRCGGPVPECSAQLGPAHFKALNPSVEAYTTPFNDACRYMDWLLTVPSQLLEILLVMEATRIHQ